MGISAEIPIVFLLGEVFMAVSFPYKTENPDFVLHDV
jgi:hypothetical protein